jgi:hypothetical protein
MSLNYILSKPINVEDVENIYPIQLKDWDEFDECANILLYSRKHFKEDVDYPLLTLIVYAIQENREPIVTALETVFKLCFRTDNVLFFEDEFTNSFYFAVDNFTVDVFNYDLVREVIMKQNLLFEPKIYKDPLMQAWANKVLESRSKNATDMSLEDRVSTVAALSGKHYWDLEKYTMYQLSVEFNRICKVKDYEVQTLAFSNPYADTSKMKLNHFAEKVDVFKSPYDDLFKSKDKLNNINKAIKE